MNSPLDHVAIFAFAFALIFGAMELIRYYYLKAEKLEIDLMNARAKNKDLELALNDIVETFAESGVNMHRNAFEKITSISRGRAVLGKIAREEIEIGARHA